MKLDIINFLIQYCLTIYFGVNYIQDFVIKYFYEYRNIAFLGLGIKPGKWKKY